MYSLFEIRKVLSVSKPGGERSVNILLTAYSEIKERSILALVCDNGYLLFRYINSNLKTPVIRQLCWFNCPDKKIKALSFDATGVWLLIVTQDATIYILPIFSLLEIDAKVPVYWKADNLTEIKLTGKRAPLTSVQWWQTHEGQHIAVIGSELGEISFINLMNKKEVGGTYITTGISALDILYDESHDTTYLLITGSNQQQWRLLLEEKKSNFYWPFSSEAEVAPYSPGKGVPLADKASFPDEKSSEQRPHYLSKFESGTFLTPQCGDGRNLVSAYNSSSSLLQVLEGDLDQMHLFSYKIPPDCENIILTDKLIFTTIRSSSSSSQQYILKIFSRKYSEISSENSKKKDAQNSEVQKFVFNDEILSLYKAIISYPNKNSKLNSVTSTSNAELLSHASEILEKSSFDYDINDENSKSNLETKKNIQSYVCKKFNLEGCILVQKDSVWECRLRISPEELFLSLTAIPGDLPSAEKLGVMLGLDLHKLYEIAADTQLCNGQFAQAVHLYQLSKCPQLKRVAHFMGYGFLSELIAYIQVLFSTKGVEIVSADKCHFANIALHCFAHQAKAKLHEKNVISVAFKKFLKENVYYDEEVAAKLLAEQGLYDLAYYFAKVRGQQGLMVETLLSTQGIKTTIDDVTYDTFNSSGYQIILQHFDNENYMKCMTSFHLLQFLAAKPSFLSMHLQHLITLLPRMTIDLLHRVAYLYDPSRKTAKLTFRNMSSKGSERYWSLTSLATVSSEIFEANQKEEELTSGEDIIKFFIFVLLMIWHKLSAPKFCQDLIPCDISNSNLENAKAIFDEKYFDPVEYKKSPLSCGQAHAAVIQNGILYTWGKTGSGRLGTEDLGLEYQAPQPVQTLLRLQVNVISVSCGALHTLALTDCGIFGWGSSRFGQLGAGEVQQAIQPIIIESLLTEEIAKVECGQYHSLALTRDGRVFSWGWGIHGQLGHGNAEDVNMPKFIACLQKKKIISVSAGQGHTVLLSQNGDVYTFGCGMFGQLGTGSVLKQSYPQRVNIPERIQQVASGHFHVLALTRSNKLYCWGCNPQALRMQAQNSRRARQHGNILAQNSRSSNHISASYMSSNVAQRSPHINGTLQQNHLFPNLVNISSITSSITELSCGSHHSVVVTASGEVYSWGRNSEGQIGNGTRKEQKTPSVVLHLKEREISYVACGADFTIVIDSNGKMYGWGQNDGGQIGQKPSPEHSAKSTSGSSTGRVITIRTNRRMITITQPCRQSILHPAEITLPRYDFKICDLESGSFENDFSIMKLLNQRSLNKSLVNKVPELSELDDPPYGHYAIHAALKGFYRFCDSSTLLNHCLNFGNYQAAAKLCALENLYDQALDYQLKAVASHFSSDDINIQMVMYIIKYYTGMIDPENVEANENFLCYIIKFWMDNNLPIFSIESYFKEHLHIFSYPLSLVMFSDKLQALNSTVRQEFLSQLSAKFCLDIIYWVLKNVQKGSHYINLLDEMVTLSDSSKLLKQIHASDALTAWDDSVPPERLWMDILRNIQNGVTSLSAILLSASDVDSLAKSLLSDKIYSQSFNNMPSSINKFSSGENDTVIFSCGHHHTLSAFQTNILPLFKESMNMLSYSLPHTTKLLLSEYHANVISAACPKCVVTEINNDL